MILVTGGSGFLGWNLLRTRSGEVPFTATYRQHRIGAVDVPWIPMDLSSPDSIRKAVESTKPKAVIHTAAFKDVDLCEKMPDEANRINVRSTEVLSEVCARTGSRVIYVSTDLVFDGTKSPCAESDPAVATSVYARTKRDAEKIILSRAGNAVVRVALLYGWSNGVNKSFVDWMWGELGKNKPVRLFKDQYRTPILAQEAGRALVDLATRADIEGLFHLGGPERISRFEFGVKVCEHFPFDPRCIQAVTMEEMPSLLPRPMDCSLNSEKLTKILNLELSDVSSGLAKMSKEYREGLAAGRA